jgi:hypothetical protein
MRKNIIMLCSALSFAMAATDDACAMVNNFVDIANFGNAEASTTGLIADLEKEIKGKQAGDTITISFPPGGGGNCPIITCLVQSVKRFVSLIKKGKASEEESCGVTLFGSFLPSVILSAFLFPCKISIPKTCPLELGDMSSVECDVSGFLEMVKIEKVYRQDGWIDFLLLPQYYEE